MCCVCCYLEPDAHDPAHDPVVGPDQHVLDVRLGQPPPLRQRVAVEVEELEALHQSEVSIARSGDQSEVSIVRTSGQRSSY